MSVEKINVIDFVSHDKNGNIVLTISDHLEWDEKNEHLLILQNKINAYLEAIENGSLYINYPKAKNSSIIINVVAKYATNENGKVFLKRIKKSLEDAGYGFSLSLPNEDF